MTAQNLTGAGWYFSAAHRDPMRQEIHGHSYEVTAYWPTARGDDAVVLQEKLRQLLTCFDHKTLPDDCGRAEDLAREIGKCLEGCVRVDIWRPSERLGCEVWL